VHHRVAAALHNVGIAKLRAGKLEEAMSSIEEAVKMRKKTLGGSHPKVAVSRINEWLSCDPDPASDCTSFPLRSQDSLVELGIIHLSLKEYDDALKVFKEALHMRQSESRDSLYSLDAKENKLKLAKVLNNIGCVNFERDEMTEALNAFESAVKMQRSALAPESRDFTVTVSTSKPSYLTMACTLCNKGSYISFRLHSMY
jgi:tetratricopeptide (TPR) repeat protein